MSNKEFHIPRYGGAGVALFGVEFDDTHILIISVFLAVLFGRLFSTWCYLIIPYVGYKVNKFYLDWKSSQLKGYFKNYLFGLGVSGYSEAFSSRKVVFCGDDAIINPSLRVEHSRDLQDESGGNRG